MKNGNRPLNRRLFLKSMALTTGTIDLPTVLPSSILGAGCAVESVIRATVYPAIS
jgi:hypothetical protein